LFGFFEFGIDRSLTNAQTLCLIVTDLSSDVTVS